MDDFKFSSKITEGMLGMLNFEKSSCPLCGSFIKHGKRMLKYRRGLSRDS